MRTRRPEWALPRWLPLHEVAPIPGAAPRALAPSRFDPALAEVAATFAVAPPAALSRGTRTPGRASAVTWRGTTVALLALAMVAAAAAGLVVLRSHGSSARESQRSVAVPRTGLVLDKPAGWAEGPIESAPSVLTDLVDVSGAGSEGLFFTSGGGRAVFVVDAPNSADLDAVPPVPDRIGTAVVSSQAPFAHDLGPARKVLAQSDDPAARFGLEADYVLAEGRIVVVGAFAEGSLDSQTIAAAAALLESLRPR